MAQRFGGKYSPGPTQPPHPFHGKRRTKAGGRVNLLFLVPFVFVITGFQKEPLGLALNLAAFGLLILAAWLTREGLIAQEAYEARSVARRPAFPRKMFGAALTGAGLFLGGVAPGAGLLNPVIFAALGIILHILAFGIDPLRSKGLEGADRSQSDRVARAVETAEKHLAAMQDAISRAGDRRLDARVARFADTARQMFRRIEEDPRDLTASRKYLGVYLQGSRDATAKFADLYARSRDPQARGAYEALLDDLEANFTARTQALLRNDRSDLDVEIEVLRERLQREGLRSD